MESVAFCGVTARALRSPDPGGKATVKLQPSRYAHLKDDQVPPSRHRPLVLRVVTLR